MNRSLLIGLSLLVSPALAHGQDEDRYGPSAMRPAPLATGSQSPSRANATATAAAYKGAFLAWPNKPQGERADLSAPERPLPVAAAPMPGAAPMPSPAPVRVDTPRPASLYDAPQPPPSVSARQNVAPPPVAAPPPPAASVAVAVASPPAQGTAVRARFYSLHRAYGDRPDAIGVPAERPTVLIGPSDSRAAQADDDETGARKTSDAPF